MSSAPAPSVLRGLLPFAVASVVLVVGWRALWFLCDDAFIAFRYVGNAHDGHGFVWNPAPFQPVEGYSCFLWVLLLHVVWLLTGITPPVGANPLALLCSLLTLWLVARRLRVVVLPAALEACRMLLATVVLLGIASSHTFATWTSSGLETAMFGLWAVGWTLEATGSRERLGARDLARLALWASLAQLTRPDGALLLLATGAIAAHGWWSSQLRLRDVAAGAWPFAVPLLHLGWRLVTYGEWLPNTYYAKVTAAWPESGLRYLYCFVVEHALWLWLPLAAAWAIAAGRRDGALQRLVGARFPAAVAAAAWLFYVGYYTWVVGGDHFGFRPFAHLVPLLFLSALAMGASLRAGPRLLAFGLAVFAACGNGFGWWCEQQLQGREKDGFVRASTAMPGPLGRLYATRDRYSAWLRLRYVGLPRGLHAATCADLLRTLPERREGQVASLPAGHRGVFRTVAAGVVAWALRDVVVLDAAGLSDWVVARNRVVPSGPALDAAALRPLFGSFDRDGDRRLGAAEIAAAARTARFDLTGVLVSDAAWADLLLAICDRNGDGLDDDEFLAAIGELQNGRHMAHERTPPPGYFEALRPNVVFDGARFAAVPGIAPLTDAEIVAVEREFRARIGR